ncbi:serine hydrolase domain-containing protein [Alteromonas lipolytica]|uniref:Beta-lactamase-related domain-containing protein n=1 Tax=Alteromonas lipolytica TaxID=1856405 RepID=A0A1E8FEK6_9ALTE|nr:serine hydrolase domain-containing protein [Alteromonas lipolytica]OFI34351.1 hypothetical protein BFC17_18365 [Alteromonas lipolytica]GGF82214.1 hypothetical protein GCM10011338_38120 [Alteromonas lipolytica]
MCNRIPLGALLSVLFYWVIPQPVSAEEINPSLSSLDADMAVLLEERHIPSLSYAIIQPGKPVHIKSIGLADKVSNTPVKQDSQYRIASISKLFVAIAAMQLIEQGRIDPEAKVRDVLPDFIFDNPWEDSHPLLVKHLLESTTGWDDLSLMEFTYDNRPPMPLDEALNLHPDSHISRWPPGTRHAYSNSAAAVAALLVEKTSGTPFKEYVKARIWQPLGMDKTTFEKPDELRKVTGYSSGRAIPHQHQLIYPAGGASSSIDDLATLLALYIKRGAPLLTSGSVARMERSQTTNAGDFAGGYGVYNFAITYDNWRFRGHDGSITGWASELAYLPQTGAGFVILQNSDDQRAFYQASRKLADFITASYPLPDVDKQPVPEEWQARTGFYRPINLRIEKQAFLERMATPLKIDITNDGVHLYSVATPGFNREAVYVGDNIWVNDKGAVVMTIGTDPEAGEVIHYGNMVLLKTSAFDVFADKAVLLLWVLSLLISLVYTPIWLINRARGKITTEAGTKLRKWMSLSMLSAAIFIVLLAVGLANPFEYLSAPGLVSLGIMVMSVVFAVITLYACVVRLKYRGSETSRWLRGFVGGYLILQLLVVVYLFFHGVIGMLTWT